ncbi:MAG TPA: DUF2079 domain-containing protein [bacterium]|nr:DUF2079 domain-containing protein [bacterium]HPJ71430.1 DUF2079 domain-containing protein [bacterium]HPQ65367.1 DUF2079 domain-containing protein [bacterium]
MGEGRARTPLFSRPLVPAVLILGILAGLAAAGRCFFSGPIDCSLGWMRFSCTTAERPLLISLISAVLLVSVLIRRGWFSRPSPTAWAWGLGGVALLWSAFYGGVGVYLHRTWRSSSLDMALHSQILWNILRGRFLESSFFEHNFAANHFWPGLCLLAPVYGVFGNEGMIVLQAAVVAFGAFGVYLLGRLIAGSRRWAWAGAITYLLHPTLTIGVLFDYHFELFAVTPAVFGIYFLLRRRWWAAGAVIAAAVSLYEINAVPFMLAGLILAARPGWRRPGLILAAACAAYLVLLVEVIMPHFRYPGYFPHLDRFRKLGRTPWLMVKHFFSAPVAYLRRFATPFRLENLWYLLRSVGFVALLGAEWLLPVLPIVLGLYLSMYELQIDIRVGYVAPTLPFMLTASFYGARRLFLLPGRLGGWIKAYGVVPFLAVTAASSLWMQFHRPFRENIFEPPPYRQLLAGAAALIPPRASLSADNHIGPHFVERDILLVTPQVHFRNRPVDYIFTDFNTWGRKDRPYLWRLRRFLEEGRYGPIFFSGGVLVLKRGRLDPVRARRVLEYMNSRNL